MDLIKKLFKFNGESYLNYIKSTINNSKEIRNKILKEELDTQQKIKLLIDDTYTFNILIKCLLTKLLITNNKMELEYYDKCNSIIDEYNYNFNTDVELLKVIINLYTNTTNQDYKFFLYKLIKSQEKYGSCSKNHDKIITILKNIDKIENLINEIITKPVSIEIDRKNIDAKSESIVSSIYPDRKNTVVIDKSRYYYLLKKISEKKIRDGLENQFMRKYNDILPAISKLIISRDIYANLLEQQNYYSLVSLKTEDDTENIKVMLKDLNDKIDIQIKDIFNNLKKFSNNDKLSLNDMIYGIDKMMPEIKFKPVDIIQVIILLIQSKFNIYFKQSNISLSREANPIEIYDKDKKLRGYLFLDLIKNTKRIKQLTLINLCRGLGNNLPILYLMGNYTDLEKPICSFSDVVLLFREFGNILNNIFTLTPTGVAEDDIEVINFLPDLMEYFAYDRQVLNTLCKFHPKSNIIVKSILDVRYYELMINIKLKCINISFDNIIHSSSELINLLKKNKDYKHNLLLELYKKIYKELFENLEKHVDFNLNFIPPQIIHNIIRGNQGLLYGTVLSTILAYNAYSSIIKGDKVDMLINLMENKNYSYKQNLINFISSINEDYYNKFLKDCLKIKEIKSENYFDETTTSQNN